MVTTTPIDGAVIYTDGSARPNPGFCGSGMHGYFFEQLRDDAKSTKVENWTATERGYVRTKDLATTDANSVKIVEFINSYRSYGTPGTNNFAELQAVNMFFEQYPEEVKQLKTLHILADSQYVLNVIDNWMLNWKRNNWITSTGKPVGNRETIERLCHHIESFRTHGILTLEWIKGHNDDYGNVKADYLAEIATAHSVRSEVVDKKHEDVQETDVNEEITDNIVPTSEKTKKPKTKVKLHPLLSLKRAYFNTTKELNRTNMYYQAGWSEQNFVVGKRTPEASFCVLRLNSPDTAMEAVFEAQYHHEPEFNKLMYVDLNRVKSPTIYQSLIEDGSYCLRKDARSECLNYTDDKPVTVEVRPGELPMRAIDTLNQLEEILDNYVENYPMTGALEKGAYDYQLFDVTDHFYEAVSDSKKPKPPTLKKEFGTGTKDTQIVVPVTIDGAVKEIPLRLVFVDDIPSRNTLKRLEELHAKIFIITWRETQNLLRYSTLIVTSDAISVWSNYFANQRLI